MKNGQFEKSRIKLRRLTEEGVIDLSGGSKIRGFEKWGFHCIFIHRKLQSSESQGKLSARKTLVTN